VAIRNILTGDEPALRKKSRAITDFNKRLHVLLDDMHETLQDADGLGLAAPQVGILRRVALIVDINSETDPPEETVYELINPEITEESGEQNGSEGCLSVPDVYGMVSRPETVTVRAQDRFGDTFEITCSGLTARAACHEIDHLDGVLFTSLTDHILTDEELDALRDERQKAKEARVKVKVKVKEDTK